MDSVTAYWSIAGLAAGLLMGLGAGLLAGRQRRRAQQMRLDTLEQQLRGQEELRREREAALALAGERLAAQFSKLANSSLQQNSESFLRLARESLSVQQERARSELAAREKAVETLVKPVADALKRADEQIRDIERSRQEAYGKIHAQLETMARSQSALQVETRNLVNALRRPEVRGQWGEITLRRLVELAGMVEHCDFVEQSHTVTAEGAIRPDMIIRMPDERELVVDVKTPLDAYLEATEASSEQMRSAALQRHAAKVAERIRELSSKAYWSQFPRSPEFVILFIPGDQFLTAALNERPGLLDEALRQKVILATPTSFVALLKAVAYGWRQSVLARNAETVRTLAVDLHDRLATMAEHLSGLGQKLDSSVKAYNRVVGSLERSVLPGARKFKELGVSARKEITELEGIETTSRQVTQTLFSGSGEDEDAAPGGDDDSARSGPDRP